MDTYKCLYLILYYTYDAKFYGKEGNTIQLIMVNMK